jgi:hypothetical protein
VERAATNPEQVAVGALANALSTGVFRNQTNGGFQEGYYSTPFEMRRLLETTGFAVLDLVSLRSIANFLEAALSTIQEPLRSEVEDVLAQVGRDPAVVATGGHAVLVARKLA